MLPQRIKRRGPVKRSGKQCKPHLDFVREFGCSVPGCGSTMIDAHHVRTAANSGKGMKPADRWVVSLCHDHHMELHRGDKTFEAKYGLDLKEMAEEFARKSPHWPKLREMA